VRAHGASIEFSGRSDGLGAQIHSLFSLAAYAHLRAMTFIPRPLQNIAHSEGDTAQWDARWNRFFNLPLESKLTPESRPTGKIHKLLRLRPDQAYRANKAHEIVDLFPEAYQAVMPGFRQAYDAATEPKEGLFKTDGFRVAVHLRRGDAAAMADRCSSLELAKKRIEDLQQRLSPRHPQIEILVLSQGDPEAFDPLRSLGVRLALDADVFQSFHSMVTADALLTARSSFSYAAALLSQGEVFYEPFWHPPLPNWQDQNEL